MEIILTDITLAFDDKTLFTNVDLTIAQGDFIVIRGASGSGKSSFLRLLNRLAEPTTGTLFVDGEQIGSTEVTHYRRRVGYVQQTPVLISGTVAENLLLPFGYKSSTTAVPDRGQLDEHLNDFNLTDVKLDDPADKLSIGQKQRIALIRTVLTQPDIILGDEPTSALDPESRTIVEDRFRAINRDRKTTVVLVTHLEFDAGDTDARHFTIEGGQLSEALA